MLLIQPTVDPDGNTFATIIAAFGNFFHHTVVRFHGEQILLIHAREPVTLGRKQFMMPNAGSITRGNINCDFQTIPNKLNSTSVSVVITRDSVKPFIENSISNILPGFISAGGSDTQHHQKLASIFRP